MRIVGRFVLVIGALGAGCAAAGCGDTSEETAFDQAAEDLRCDGSKISVLDTFVDRSDEPLIRYRLFACGRDVVYACEVEGTRRHRHWVCRRDGFRFPV